MANERRVRPNFLSGVVDDNPLASNGTTLNATELSNLEAIDSAEHAVLILDPEGAGNGPEIAYITAHTGGATSATISRGREGTSGVEHAQNTDFIIGPVASDWPTMLASSADRPASGGLPYPGQLAYEIDKHRYVYYDHAKSLWFPAFGLMPAFRLGRTTTQTIPEGAWTDVEMNSEGIDTDSLHSGSDAHVTIPAGLAGMWHFEGYAEFAANDDATAPRGVRILCSDNQVAGVSLDAAESSAFYSAAPSCSGIVSIAGGVTVKLQAFHHGSDLGLDLDDTAWPSGGIFAVFCGRWLGPAV